MAFASTPEFKLSSSQTAIALVVPAHFQSQINAIRKIHDKAYRKWEPHINILYPFVEAALLPSALAAIRAHLPSSPISQFIVKADDVGTFEHMRSATVFLKPGEESEQQLCMLRRELVAALGRSEQEGTHDGTFRPHLTIGQASLIGTTKERLVQKVGKLVGLEWEVERLVVLRREGTGEMAVVDEIRLCGDGGDGIPGFADTLWKPCYHFHTDIGWQQMLKRTRNHIYSQESSRANEIIITSYNLMSDPDAPQFSSRLPHIMEAISQPTLSKASSIRVLCLQEVDEEMLPFLLSDPKLQQLFPFSTHSSSSLLPCRRNLVTFCNEAFSLYILPFKERYKYSLIIRLLDISIQVANVHLTRGLADEAVAAKKDQMKALTDFLVGSQNSIEGHTFVGGDFNLNSSSKTLETALSRGLINAATAQSIEDVIGAKVWSDAFLVFEAANHGIDEKILFDGEQGATFDRLKNPLASMSKVVIDSRPQRYDRILYKKGGAETDLLNFEIFGRPSADGTCPSDHYGICAVFEMKVMRNTIAGISTDLKRREAIKIVEDSTDIKLLIHSCLPTTGDRQMRKEAIHFLQETLSRHRNLADLILAPLGSYAMDTYFADSDVDVLAIACVTPQLFFTFATEQLRALTAGNEHSFKGVHFVNSLVSIIEVNILGIKFDIQYCQASELVKRYHSTTPSHPLENPVFDNTLISKLSPTSLRPLNTYRSTIYLLDTLPSLDSYRIAHRFLALYLKHHGLYSAKFGYLGGIHLSLLLNRVLKLIPREKSSSLTPATIIRTFFEYYSTFDWALDTVCDPDLDTQKKRVDRTARDAIVIQALHLPAARPNVAASCTRLSALAVSTEFEGAGRHLENGEWEACLSSHEFCVSEFLKWYGAYVAISIQLWDGERVDENWIRDVIGSVESRIVRLLVDLGRIEGLEGRAWPERFCAVGEVNESKKEEWQGWYLVGIKSKEQSEEKKKSISSKVSTVAKDFESCLKQARSMEEEGLLISVEVTSKKRLKGLRLVVDERQ